MRQCIHIARARQSLRAINVRMGLVLFLLAMPAWCVGPAQAQDTPPPDTSEVSEVDLGADILEGFTVNGEQLTRLIGNVRLRQDETTLWSDRATEYPGREEVLFVGNVVIVDEGDTLWAERVLYNRQTKVGRAEGNVRLSDGDVRLKAPSGIYYVDEKRAELTDGVEMVDSTAVLTSREGQYWLDEKRAEFYDDVLLVEQQSNLEADSVTYFRETEVALARSNVFIEHVGAEEDEAGADSTSRVYLFGDSAYHDYQAGFSRIEGRPLLVRVEEDTAATVDTLLVRARILESTRTDSLDHLVAVDSVRIWRGAFAAVADSVVSTRIRLEGPDSSATREEIHLFGDPVAWYEDTQMTGDTVVVKARSGSIDSLLVRSDAFVAQLDTALGRIQQLRGRDLTGLFEDDSLRTLLVAPNAEAIYYVKGEEGGTSGALRASGDTARFRFEENTVSDIKFTGDIQGTQYPADLIPEPFDLEGFRWMPDRRPAREEMLERAGDRLLPPAPDPAFTSITAPPIDD